MAHRASARWACCVYSFTNTPEITTMTIPISRRVLRSFLAVIRRGGLARPIQRSGVRLVADGSTVRLQARHNHHAVEYRYRANGPATSLVLNFELLVACAARDDQPILLQAGENNTVVARWTSAGVPQVQTFDAPAALPDMLLSEPPRWSPPQLRLPAAMNEALATADPDSMRYALGCLQFCGASGKIVATDGRQILVQGGFAIPWRNDRLVWASKLWTASELASSGSACLGFTDDHLAIRTGPWTFWQAFHAEGRYPDWTSVFGRDRHGDMSRCQLSDHERAFLLDSIAVLPGSRDRHQAVTIDTRSGLAIRARDSQNDRIVTLRLPQARVHGPGTVCVIDRTCLLRALKLGFSELSFQGKPSTLIARDSKRQFAWATLSDDAAVLVDGDTVITPPAPISVHRPRRRAIAS
jgi:hypothetical protein